MTQNLFDAAGIGADRLHVAWVSSAEAQRFVEVVTEVTESIRSPEVTSEVSRVSAVPLVRRVVQAKQREVTGRIVAEGRDIGSVVFPQAQVKVYLDASLAERATRRHRQYPEFSIEEYEERIRTRDTLDSTREDSPLVQADGAIHIDTTGLSIDEVLDRVRALVDERRNQGGGSGQPGQRGKAPA